jgi:hypothetical protein
MASSPRFRATPITPGPSLVLLPEDRNRVTFDVEHQDRSDPGRDPAPSRFRAAVPLAGVPRGGWGPIRPVPASDTVLAELAAAFGRPGWAADGAIELSVARPSGGSNSTDPTVRIDEHERPVHSGGASASLAVVLLAAGFCAHREKSNRSTIPARSPRR